MVTMTPVTTGSSSSTVRKESTPESKIKAAIEKGFEELLKTGDVESKDSAWSLGVESDPQAIREYAKSLEDQKSRIPDPASDPREFF